MDGCEAFPAAEQAGLSRELCAAVANGSATLREVVQQILSLAENLLQNQNPSGGQTEMGGIGNPDGTVNKRREAGLRQEDLEGKCRPQYLKQRY